MSFEGQVFINCPFDEDYKKLLRPLVFEIIYLGFVPKLSQTISSSAIRVDTLLLPK